MKAEIEKMEAQLEVWDAKIINFAVRADKARGQAQADLRYHVDSLKVKRAMAHAKLDEMRAAGKEKQENLKEGLETAWKDLEAAFKKLGKKLGS